MKQYIFLLVILVAGCSSTGGCTGAAECAKKQARHQIYTDCISQHRQQMIDLGVLNNAGLSVDMGTVIDQCHALARRRVP